MESEPGKAGAARGVGLRIWRSQREVEGVKEERFVCEVDGRRVAVLGSEAEARGFWLGFKTGVEEALAAWEGATSEPQPQPRRFSRWLQEIRALCWPT